MAEMKFGLGANPYSAGYATGVNGAWDLVTGEFDQGAYDNAAAECNDRAVILDSPATNDLDRESYSAELAFWRGVVEGMDSERNHPSPF